MGPCLSTPPSAPFEPPFDPGECTAETDLAVLESWRDSQPKSKLAEWWPKDKDKSQWQRVTFDGAGRVIVVGVHIGGITGVIPADLGLLTELHGLDLHANAFEGPVPKQLGQLTKLQRLTLGGPGGHGLTSLPKELGKCKDLSILMFANTQLKEFPNELCDLPKLKRLELSNCRELVRLPYVNFPELENLNISGCDRLVALPEGLVSCHKLKTLNFEFCPRLTGFPPGLLGELKKHCEIHHKGVTIEEAPKNAPAAAAAPKAAKASRGAVPKNAVPKNAPAQAPGAITPLTNLPDEADALETGCLRVLGVWHRPGEPADGKFFRFDATRLGKMLVSRFGEAHFRSLSAESQPDKLNHSRLAKFTGDAERDDARGDVKSGKGAVLRCVNKRSGKASAVLLFDVAMGEDINFGGVGCWNPPALAAADDFKQGDVLLFPDLVVEDKRFPALVPNSVAANTGTGWNRPAGDARFGRCGLVGDYWKALELEFTFDKDTLVAGLYLDAPTTDEMPLEVAVLRGDADAGAAENWQKIETKTVGSARVFAAEPVSCRRVRARWATTDLHKLGGLNTARSGGGIHAHPVGPAAAPAAAAAPRAAARRR